MWVWITTTFDTVDRRYRRGDNVDVDPQLAAVWMSAGVAVPDADQVSQVSDAYGGAGAITAALVDGSNRVTSLTLRDGRSATCDWDTPGQVTVTASDGAVAVIPINGSGAVNGAISTNY